MTCPSPDFRPHLKGHNATALGIKGAFRIRNLGVILGHVHDVFRIKVTLWINGIDRFCQTIQRLLP